MQSFQSKVERAASMDKTADIPPPNTASRKHAASRRRNEEVLTFNGYTFDRRPGTKEDRERLMKALARAS